MRSRTTVRLASLTAIVATSWALVASSGSEPVSAQPVRFPVHIRVQASKPVSPWQPIWRFFGADEPNYAYLKNGRKLLGELGELAPQAVYFRAHNLLNSGDGTPALKWGSTGVYRQAAPGQAQYDWTILDRIFDAYHAAAVRPYVEIGFMPKDLSVKPEPYQHHWTPRANYNQIFTGWAYPPKDYRQWSELVYQWAKHCLEKYGTAEVSSWFWETWNEPNIGYWRGTPAEFFKLHDTAVEAVRRAVPSARVGGPDVAGSGGQFMRRFLEHCLRGTNFATGKIGTPLDFVSFHAKGAPRFINGHVQMGIATHLRTIRDGLALIASYPELKDKPVVLGESDPEGCAACQGPQLGYRNGTMYSSYTASSFARTFELAEKYRVHLLGALTWAFEFEDQPYFAGFRALASGGLDKPVLNVFRMFSKMSGRQLEVSSDSAIPLERILRDGARTKPDVSALAARQGSRITVMVWHYHDDDLPGPKADVEIELDDLPPRAGDLSVHHFRIDHDHSNAYTAWRRLGSPQKPSPDQMARLEKAAALAELPDSIVVTDEGSTVHLNFPLPRQAVSLVVLKWSATGAQ